MRYACIVMRIQCKFIPAQNSNRWSYEEQFWDAAIHYAYMIMANWFPGSEESIEREGEMQPSER